MTKDPYKIDEDTEPLTDEEIKRLRPAPEVLKELGVIFKHHKSLKYPKSMMEDILGRVNK